MDFYISLHPQIRKGGIAQLVEHLLCKQRVAGSNPTTSTRKRPSDASLTVFLCLDGSRVYLDDVRAQKKPIGVYPVGLLLKCPRGERSSEIAGRRQGKSDYLHKKSRFSAAFFIYTNGLYPTVAPLLTAS